MKNNTKESKKEIRYTNIQYLNLLENIQTVLNLSRNKFHREDGKLFAIEDNPNIRQEMMNEFCEKEMLELKLGIEKVLNRLK